MTRHAAIHIKREHQWHDYPEIPVRFERQWLMEVLPEGGVARACSDTLVECGMWEPPQTLAMCLIFERLPHNVFVDFGANVGYYSMLAAALGIEDVAAYDGWDEVYPILDRNLQGFSETTWAERVWIDDRLEMFTGSAWRTRRFTLKIDLEGADHLAIRAVRHCLDQVDAVLIELSPVFNEGWKEAVDALFDAGFVAALMPDKARPPMEIDQLADFDFHDNPGLINWTLSIAGQWDALFVRSELL